MRLSWRRRLSVYAGLGAIAIAVVSVVGAGPASADQTITHTFPQVACTATVEGIPIASPQDITVGFVVPDQVNAGETFPITFPGGTATLPSSADGFSVGTYQGLSLTFQINGTTFDAGSVNNPGTATIVPTAPPSTPKTITETASVSGNHYTSGTPGPFAPGALTTPTISMTATAPASGDITLQAFQLTTQANLSVGGKSVAAPVTCAIPNTILATIPVIPAGGTTTTTTGGSTTSTTVGATTTTTVGATTTTTTGGSTTSTTAGPTTTTTVPVAPQGSQNGSGSNINNCTTHLTPAALDVLVPDGTAQVGVTISATATPSPHLGKPITLTNTKVTVSVPPALIKTGYEAGVLVSGDKIPSTLALSVTASNTTQGTRAYPLIHADPVVTISDPTPGDVGNKDETAQPLSVTSALPDSVWTPTSNTANVIFTEKSAVVAATLNLSGTSVTDTITCSVTNPNSFMAVGATGAVTTTTNTVAAAAVATTTTVAAAASTLPFTGSNIAIWMVLAAITLDAGIVLIMGTRKKVSSLVHKG